MASPQRTPRKVCSSRVSPGPLRAESAARSCSARGPLVRDGAGAAFEIRLGQAQANFRRRTLGLTKEIPSPDCRILEPLANSLVWARQTVTTWYFTATKKRHGARALYVPKGARCGSDSTVIVSPQPADCGPSQAVGRGRTCFQQLAYHGASRRSVPKPRRTMQRAIIA